MGKWRGKKLSNMEAGGLSILLIFTGFTILGVLIGFAPTNIISSALWGIFGGMGMVGAIWLTDVVRGVLKSRK